MPTTTGERLTSINEQVVAAAAAVAADAGASPVLGAVVEEWARKSHKAGDGLAVVDLAVPLHRHRLQHILECSGRHDDRHQDPVHSLESPPVARALVHAASRLAARVDEDTSDP